MATTWTYEERKILQDNIVDGVEIQTLEQLLPDRSYWAIVRQAQNLDFGVKTIDGVKVFVGGKGTRISNRNTESTTEKMETVDEIEVATNNSTPTELEHLNNESAEIIAEIELNLQLSTEAKNDVLRANAKAIEIISNYGLKADIEFIYCLSKHIVTSKSA